MMGVVVFGSLNMDLVSQVPRLPVPGETILGDRFVTTPGGKGANQAVAVAKLGVPTAMVGRVGADDFGRSLIAGLQAQGINTDGIGLDPDSRTGVAIITVAATGENQIIGIFGANGQLDDQDRDRLQLALVQAQAQYLMLQLEVNWDAVQQAAKLGKAANLVVILDPAPVQTPDLSPIYPHIDWLLPNQLEAEQLVGFAVRDRATAQRAATQLRSQGVPNVAIKLGEQGVYCQTAEAEYFVPGFTVAAIDTVACGDAFAGGFVAALWSGESIPTALRWGNAAGALTATQAGAQVAMPDREAFDRLLAISS
jgi:ribokinase